jgi:hypothetical protein
MSRDDRPAAPGVKWRKRRAGPVVPYWLATAAAIKAGYPIKTVNLSTYAAEPEKLKARAKRLQDEMLLWLSGAADREPPFDGTFASLLDLYERDPQSTINKVKARTRRSYDVYVKKLRTHIGARRITACDGRDVMRWFAEWRAGDGNADHLPRAKFVLAVLKAAVSWGIICKKPGCAEFQAILHELTFETIPARTQAPTAIQIEAARKAAHENGAPLRALGYAIQFETSLRQEDVIGRWLPMADAKISDVHSRGNKWSGLRWSDVSADWLVKVKPSKTATTTGAIVVFDLSCCPMVMAEFARLARVPIGELRRDMLPTWGPIITNHNTGKPYGSQAWNDGWRKDHATAGLPPDLWNRDLRAGAVTEGTVAGASLDDRRRLAGHARSETTEIYDREITEAHRRAQALRVRARTKNSGGNAPGMRGTRDE